MTTSTPPRQRSTLRTPEEERACYLGLAKLARDRGYPNLAQSYEHIAGEGLSTEERRANLSRSWVAWRAARGMDEGEEG
jgi:hypothetical protein